MIVTTTTTTRDDDGNTGTDHWSVSGSQWYPHEYTIIGEAVGPGFDTADFRPLAMNDLRLAKERLLASSASPSPSPSQTNSPHQNQPPDLVDLLRPYLYSNNNNNSDDDDNDDDEPKEGEVAVLDFDGHYNEDETKDRRTKERACSWHVGRDIVAGALERHEHCLGVSHGIYCARFVRGSGTRHALDVLKLLSAKKKKLLEQCYRCGIALVVLSWEEILHCCSNLHRLSIAKCIL
jgi:hypothetical protein